MEEEFHGNAEDVEGTYNGFEAFVPANHAGAFEAQHFGDVGSSDVCVEDANHVSFPSECGGEVDGDSGFTNATFTGEDGDLMFDMAHFFSDFLFSTSLSANLEIFGNFT